MILWYKDYLHEKQVLIITINGSIGFIDLGGSLCLITIKSYLYIKYAVFFLEQAIFWIYLEGMHIDGGYEDPLTPALAFSTAM